jgi:UDP-N-acetylmuramate dehydrogenase
MAEAFIKNQPLRDLSTFAIGGPARYFVTVKTQEEAQEALRRCHEESLDFFVLGKGSNSLFDDRGFDGLVIQNKILGRKDLGQGRFAVGAGYSFALLGVQTARAGWGGLEFASGIPGSIGGALFMNAGANGADCADAVESVDFLTLDGTLKTFSCEELSFSYRTSIFHSLPGLILGATFALKAMGGARQRQIEIVDYRKRTQPYGESSVGCIFQNPAEGSAGALIENSGLKGLSVGAAEVSTCHANFIINKGGATAADVLELIALVKERVYEATGIHLDCEARLIPYRKS